MFRDSRPIAIKASRHPARLFDILVRLFATHRRRTVSGVAAGILALGCWTTRVPAQSTARRVQPSVAATGGYLTESWTVRDGLPVNSITALVQTRDGYLWIATYDGLVRFDGVRFTVFTTANTPGLPSDRLIRLVEGCDRTLWLMTEQGQLVRFRDGRAVVVDPERGVGRNGPHIRYDMSACTLWVAVRRGIGVVRAGSDRVMPVARERITGEITALTLMPGGGVVAAAEGRLYRVASDGSARTLTLRGPPVSSGIASIHAERSGQLWAATGLGLWGGRDTLTFTPLSNADAGTTVYEMRRSPSTGALWLYGATAIYRLRESAPGATSVLERMHTQTRRQFTAALWADSSAIWYAIGNVIYREGRAVHALPSGDSASTDPTEVGTALVDREGSIWLGTQSTGLHRLTSAVFRAFGTPEGIGGNNIYPVFEDRAGALWLGTWGAGLSRLDPTTGVATDFRTAGGILVYVQTIIDDGPGRLLLGSGSGLHACEFGARRSCRREGTAQMGNTDITALFRDDAGALWAAGVESMHRRVGGEWRPVPGAPTAAVRGVAQTADGALWMATNGAGLARWAGGRFTHSVTMRDGLPTDAIRALHADRDGWLWIGTEGVGMARLDPRAWTTSPPAGASRRIVRIGAEQGLVDGTVHQLLPDDADRLWLSTNRGILRVARSELLAVADGRATRVSAVTYTERDGMRNREANGGYYPMGVRARDGRLWFPTQGGVVVVDPRSADRARTVPSVAIEQVVTPAATRVANGDTIVLAATERDIEFRYAAPTFVEPTTLRFRYRLNGYDTDWVDAGARRTAFYTRVPPGRYTFRVAVRTASGPWSDGNTALVLDVTPRWWETTFVRVLAAAMVLLLIVAAVQVRLRLLRRRAALLETVVAERTGTLREREAQLESRNAQLAELVDARSRLFANLSHEFRTPLTLILGPLRSLLDGRHGPLGATVREQGDLMERNGQRLLRLINQVLDLSRLQAGAVVLDTAPRDLDALVRATTLAFAPLAERRRITLTVESDATPIVVAFDTEQLEKVLLNLLSNALKFTPPGGRVVVGAHANGDDAVITVRDSGVGIAPDALPRVFDRFWQADSSATRSHEGTGIGLALARELAELHGGTIAVASEPGVGSTFTLRLPLVRDPAAVARVSRAAHATAHATTHTTPVPNDDAGVDWTAPLAPAAAAATVAPDDDRTTLLLVDDNADVRAFVRSLFVARYRILEAENGRAGLETARASLPDLVIADVMMPELDGLALGRALHENAMTDAIPLVLLTARADAADQVAGLETGADAYLTKPFEPAVLEATVEALLTQRRRLRERFRSEDAPFEAVSAASKHETAAEVPAEPSAIERRLRPLVELHLTEPTLDAAMLAYLAGLSYHQLYRALREGTAESPSRFIRRIRVERAAALLQSRAGNVSEVAYSVGFESLSYFSRAFAERFGVPPSAMLRGDAVVAATLPDLVADAPR